MATSRAIACVVAVAAVVCSSVWAAEDFAKDAASAALAKAVAFFREQVSAEGGYLWQYSADLARREGEGKASATSIWVQPPGTPSAGQAYLDAYALTREPYLLDAARDTAYALVKGQLASGGWPYRIDFDPEARAKTAYRVPPNKPDGGNVSTLDDDTTQSALRYLMRVDETLEFGDATIHEATLFGLDALAAAQYPNGAWPQRFTGPPDPAKFPVLNASYPDDWPPEYPGADYSLFYTFNDETISDCIRTMFDAWDIYKDEKYRQAAINGGEFILRAQMPDPQPAWAQQYNHQMHPAWARKFEPPAVTGGESQGVMTTALYLYRRTGDTRFLDAVDRAAAYLESSALPDGQLARFYELKTNKPLYFTKDYQLTYNDDDMPTHYSFKGGSAIKRIAKDCAKLRAEQWAEYAPPSRYPGAPSASAEIRDRARKAAESLDERGAWVQSGRLQYHGDDDPATEIISTSAFAANIRALAQYIAATE